MADPADKEKKPAAVIQHPAQATHMALPAEVMNDLINAVGQKYTWIEIDPLMTKIKQGMKQVQLAPDGSISLIDQPPPPQ